MNMQSRYHTCCHYSELKLWHDNVFFGVLLQDAASVGVALVRLLPEAIELCPAQIDKPIGQN